MHKFLTQLANEIFYVSVACLTSTTCTEKYVRRQHIYRLAQTAGGKNYVTLSLRYVAIAIEPLQWETTSVAVVWLSFACIASLI